MLARLRRVRWIAALLVVLSPPAAGSILPVIQPCPIDLPWLAQAGQGHGHQQHDSGHHANHGQPAESQHTVCHCIGACTGASGVAHPAAGAVVAETISIESASSTSWTAQVVRPARPRFLLPPANAPPVV